MTRLKKQRYGRLNLKAPTKDDLLDDNIRFSRLRKPVPHIFDDVIYHLRFPPIRDRYYDTYIPLVEDYMKWFNHATKQSQWQSRSQIVDLHLAGKLLYMNLHPERFHGFHEFKYTWFFNLLCAMRTYIITQMYLAGEIHTNNTTSSWSAGFYPFPKPMGMNATSALADTLYDIIYERSEYIHKRSIT